MPLDLEALKARLAAQKAALATPKEQSNEQVSSSMEVAVTNTGNGIVSSNSSSNTAVVTAPVVETNLFSTDIIGTAKTSEIDHLEFMSKMKRLQDTLITKHPTMPVLLMQIHKQLRADPELVTTLSEDGIGVIVSGLQVHTKTELVSVVVKESKSKAKKTALTLDML